MDHTLTRDAKKALATIYKAYKSRRANGEAKSSAVYFDTESHDAAAIDAAVSDSLAELSNAKYVKYDRIGSKGCKANAGTKSEACDGIRNASLSLPQNQAECSDP